MGVFSADIHLINYDDSVLAKHGHIAKGEVRQLTTSMLVDSGAVMMSINETIKSQLGLQAHHKENFSMGDGSVVELDIVLGIEVHFGNRFCVTDAIVLRGDTEPLFGALPMEAMDLVITPFDRQLAVNPKHPIRAQLMLKGFRHAQ